MSESPDLFPYAKQTLLRPSLDLGRDEQVQENPASQTRGSDAIQPFAHDPRLGKGLNGLSSTHLTAIVENLPPKPTFGRRAESDEGYMPVKGDTTPTPEDNGPSAAVVYASTGEDDADDDDGFEAEDAITLENTDTTNPEKLALLEDRSPYGKKGTKGEWSASRASQAACLASLVHFTRQYDAFRPMQKYKSLKAKTRVLTPDQFRTLWQHRQQDPHASKAPLRMLELVVPKPEFQTKPEANLTARSDATTKAAAKQTSNLAGKAKSALNNWMGRTAITPSAPKPTLDRDWHFSFAESKNLKKTNWPAPGF